MPGPIKEDDGKRPVTCDRCGYVWKITWQEATRMMRTGRVWLGHRQERKGEVDNGALFSSPGTWESVSYMKGVCDNCDRGIIRPSIEWETRHIAERMQHFAAVGVDPENVTSYAIEEYHAEFGHTFAPEFQAWWEQGGWRHADSELPEMVLLPVEFCGKEPGYGDGSVFCPHVDNERAQDWDRRIA